VKKIITRIKGGLGNQLFCYAAARRLAMGNNAELVIDDVTGFARDYQYHHQYALDHFRIPCRKATPAERLEPFERYRRGVMKWLSRRKPFAKRRYLEQEGRDFDARLLTMNVKGTLHLDGLWQSEKYFKDVKATIRADLRIIEPSDKQNLCMAENIRSCCSAVAVHVRWFDDPGYVESHNVSANYYQRAIALMESKLGTPRYFLFSDDPEAARTKIVLPEDRMASVSHNRGDENAYADLWLMTQCQHFVTANSTFGWWGAWLAEYKKKIIIAPDISVRGITAWGFKGLLPDGWLRI